MDEMINKYSETKSFINQTLNKVPINQKMFVNLTCLNQTPVYFEYKSWCQGGLV
jgi:hypothetical protein